MRWPSNSNAVVTHCGWTGMDSLLLSELASLPYRSPRLRLQLALLVDDRDAFDLDQAVVVVEASNLHERHGRVVSAEVLAIDRADLAPERLVLGLGEHVDGELDDVLHLAGARHHDRLEVLADLAKLPDQIALADDVARLVDRDLPGDVHGLAALDFPSMGVTGRRWETRRIHGLHDLGHGFLLSRGWLRAIILPGLHGPPLREGHPRRRRRPPPPRYEGAARPGVWRSQRARSRGLAAGRPAGSAHPDGRAPARRLSVRLARLRGQDPVRDVAHVAPPGRGGGTGRRRLRPRALLRHGEPVRGGRAMGARRGPGAHRAPRPRRASLARRLGELPAARGAPGSARHPRSTLECPARWATPSSTARRSTRGPRSIIRCSSTRPPRSERWSGGSPRMWPSSSRTRRRSR